MSQGIVISTLYFIHDATSHDLFILLNLHPFFNFVFWFLLESGAVYFRFSSIAQTSPDESLKNVIKILQCFHQGDSLNFGALCNFLRCLFLSFR
jgi:hypothetical protein